MLLYFSPKSDRRWGGQMGYSTPTVRICEEMPTMVDCHNAEGKVAKGTRAKASDSTDKVLDKIDYAAAYWQREVVWRRLEISGRPWKHFWPTIYHILFDTWLEETSSEDE